MFNILLFLALAFLPQNQLNLFITNELDCPARVVIHHEKQTEGYSTVIGPQTMVVYSTIADVDTLILDVYYEFEETDCGCSPFRAPYEVLPRTRQSKYFFQVLVPIKQSNAFHIVKPLCYV